MAQSAEDILISVKADIQKALKDFDQLEKQIKTTQATTDNKLSPAVNNTRSKMQSLGNTMTQTGQKIKASMDGATATAFIAAGAAATAFSKECITSAINAENGWNRLGAMVNSSGGNWETQSKEVKKWASDFSNSMGYATSDTRDAMNSLMQMGLSLGDTEQAMYGVAGLAARTGQTEAEASAMVVSALNGKGMAFEKATGLELDNYKAADGTIDRQKLLNDLYNQNKEAVEKHGKSTEGVVNRMNNAWGKFKSEIGASLLPVLKTLAGAAETVAQVFQHLPQPVKSVISIALLAGGAISVVVGILGMLAPILINVGSLLSWLGKSGGFLGAIKNAAGLLKSAFPGVTGAIKTMKSTATGAYSAMRSGVSKVSQALKGLELRQKLATAATKLHGAASKAYDLISSGVSRAVTALRTMEIQTKLNTVATKLHTAAETVKNGIMRIATAVQAAYAFVMNLSIAPIYIIIIAIAALIAVLGYLYFNNEQVRNTINALANTIKGALLNAWNTLTRAVSAGWSIISGAWNNIINAGRNLVNGVGAALSNLPGYISAMFTIFVATITARLNQARAIASTLITGLKNAVISRLQQIPIQVGILLMRMVQFITVRFNQARAIAGALAGRIRTVIVQKIQGVVNNIRSLFNRIVNTIRSTLSNAASSAAAKASEIVNGIINYVSSLPQKVADEFGKIPDKIRNALANAASVALQGAQAIVNQFLAGMGINSPGFIQNATVEEMKNTAARIGEYQGTANKNARTVAEGLVNSYNNALNNIKNIDIGLDPQTTENPLLKGITDNNILTSSMPATSKTSHIATSNNNINNSTNDNTRNVTINAEFKCEEMTTAQARRWFYEVIEGV